MTSFVLAVDHRNSLCGWLKSLDLADHESDQAAKRLERLCVSALQAAREDLEPHLPAVSSDGEVRV